METIVRPYAFSTSALFGAFLSLLSLLLLPARAEQSGGGAFARANEHYTNSNYAAATKEYEKLVSEGFEAAELYYNLGNAYFKTGNTAAAILNYERALRLQPDDEDTEFNLALAQAKIVDKIEPAPKLFIVKWWRAFVGAFSAETWSWLALCCVWGLAGCAAAFLLARSISLKKIAFAAAAVLLFASALTLGCAYRQYRAETSDKSAVIFAGSAPVKSAPQDEAKDLFVLHEGTKVEVLDAQGEWKKIRIADGGVGWLRANTLQII